MAMHLTSMVHGSGREREVHDHHRHLQHQHQQQHSKFYGQQPQQRPYGLPSSVSASVSASPYSSSHPHQPEYHYQRGPQSPPSPPVEDHKPSLPSISTLLNTAASGEKATSETGTCSPTSSLPPLLPPDANVAASVGQSPKSQHNSSPKLRQEQQGAAAGAVQHQSDTRVESVPHSFGPAIVSNPRMTLPPTPPMHPDPVVDGNQSPSATSTHSATPYYLGQSLNNMEPTQQRQTVSSMPSMKRHSVPSQPSLSPYNTSPYAQSPYASSPGAASTGSFYSPETHYSGIGVYGQRPLPSNYQPQTMPLPVPSDAANASSMWQHHHYISATSQSAFPQSQDRYICSTCNKAFSRPSSLRIHSHSHTGEKPYKCPQPGCGKAFSVRSNMKRHERGCHASASATMTTT